MSTVGITVHRRTLALVATIVVLFTYIAAAIHSPDLRAVSYPIAAAVSVFLFTFVFLWNREGAIPIYDLGCVLLLATLCYTIIPPLQFIAAGMQHTVISAFQFWVLQPSPHEIGALTWKYTTYLSALAISYIALRRRTPQSLARPQVKAGDVRFLVTAYIALMGVLFFYRIVYGVNSAVSYSEETLNQNVAAFSSLPRFLQQSFSIVQTTAFMLKVGLLLVLILNWHKRSARVVLVVWLGIGVLGYMSRMGARTELILTLFASIIMYHRFVRPLRAVPVLFGGILLLCAFFFLGIARGAESISGYFADLSLGFEYRKALFSVQNEFQVLFAGTYDLWWLKQNGVIQHTPLQFVFYDIVMLLPQQILPFTKIDVQNWYLQQSTAPGFFMYNPIAQAMLGFGWIEILGRGLLLGAVFAAIRNWYVRNSGDFWKTLFYSYIIVMCYYGARGTALYFFAHKLIYTMLPVYLLSRITIRRSAERAEMPPVVAPAAT